MSSGKSTVSPSYRDFIWNALQNDAVRGGLCAVLMVVLALGSMSIWLALIVPWLIYSALWLVTSRMRQLATTKHLRLMPRSVRVAYAECLDLHQKIETYPGLIEDKEICDQIHRIVRRYERILEAIKEDDKYEASLPLMDLASPTNKLLDRYSKIVRRGVETPEVKDLVRHNLTELEGAYEQFWNQLNRDAIVDLEALSKAIDLDLKRLPPVPQEQTGSASLPNEETSPPREAALPGPTGGVAPSVPIDLASRIASLSPREREVLCFLSSGKTDQEIADDLFVSRRTVNAHVENICAKLGMRNRTEAAAFSVRYGLC